MQDADNVLADFLEEKLTAWKWIEGGTIARLQEGLTNLAVGFSKVLIEFDS